MDLKAAAPAKQGPLHPLRAWLLYDIASSTYAAVVPAVLFALHFTAVVAAGRSDTVQLWGLVSAAAMVVGGILAPLVGAAADAGPSRARWLGGFTLICCAATALLAVPGPGQVVWGAALFVVAQAGYTVAMSLYDSYVGRLASVVSGPELLSSRGWALGFLGGLLALLAVIALPRDAQGVPSPALAFPLVALLFLGIAIPALRGLGRLPERPEPAGAAVHPLRRIGGTLVRWREHRVALAFLAGAYLINDAMVTVMVFTAVYMREVFGLTLVDVLWLTVLYHVLALPATWYFGVLAHRTSARRSIALSLAVWTLTILLLTFGEGRAAAVAIVALLATVLGSTQALLRGLYARVIPPGRSAEFFGFNALAGRLSAALGPMVFAAVAAASGSPRWAFLAQLGFLASGGAIVWRVAGSAVLPPGRALRST